MKNKITAETIRQEIEVLQKSERERLRMEFENDSEFMENIRNEFISKKTIGICFSDDDEKFNKIFRYKEFLEELGFIIGDYGLDYHRYVAVSLPKPRII